MSTTRFGIGAVPVPVVGAGSVPSLRGAHGARWLILIERDRPALYLAARARLGDRYLVLLDRRHAERRRIRMPIEGDRRRTDRRRPSRRQEADQARGRGYRLVYRVEGFEAD